ncbi:anti-sigma factor [Nocardioides sp.]|uniref:anti-sigma factor n=1 Tax=Nocardioides sp. TaxID=35761 RepID=UPI003D0DA45A
MNLDDDHLDLSGLLLGELRNDEIGQAADHLDGCEECRSELAELAVGHALLASASRTLGGTALVPNPTDGLPARVSPARRTRRRRQGFVLAAAAALVVGIGVTGWVRLDSGPEDVAPKPFAEATLEPVEGSGAGVVVMVHDGSSTTTMTVKTSDLPKLRSGKFYYAWLLDPKTNKMLPLGQVGPAGVASFTLDDQLLARYSSVDVSLEADDGDPQHSVTSVLRASYDDAGATTSS